MWACLQLCVVICSPVHGQRMEHTDGAYDSTHDSIVEVMLVNRDVCSLETPTTKNKQIITEDKGLVTLPRLFEKQTSRTYSLTFDSNKTLQLRCRTPLHAVNFFSCWFERTNRQCVWQFTCALHLSSVRSEEVATAKSSPSTLSPWSFTRSPFCNPIFCTPVRRQPSRPGRSPYPHRRQPSRPARSPDPQSDVRPQARS